MIFVFQVNRRRRNGSEQVYRPKRGSRHKKHAGFGVRVSESQAAATGAGFAKFLQIEKKVLQWILGCVLLLVSYMVGACGVRSLSMDISNRWEERWE